MGEINGSLFVMLVAIIGEMLVEMRHAELEAQGIECDRGWFSMDCGVGK